MAEILESDNIVAGDVTGSSPDVKSNLEDMGRTITSVSQAFQVCENLIYDWKKGIANSARITAKLNGERPYNQKKLKDAGKDWKTNISTGFLQTECARVLPRLFMPIKTAKYLTAATLPIDWDGGQAKSEFYRQIITETIRSWPKFNFWIRGLAREVGIFGFGFNVFFDEYDWRPNLVRMDKGFIPMGTEVMETDPAFFMVKYDYKPSELLRLLKTAVDGERLEWQKDNVVAAINAATVPVNGTLSENLRSYEELIRQAAWIYNYTKGEKVIRTWHLFARETSGKVSHYILLADNGVPAGEGANKSAYDGKERLLYEHLDKFDSMLDCVHTMVFDYGDGTVHGAWGAGQILYDLAAQVEKVRCDSIDNMRATNKIKAQVPDAKNVNDVKLTVNDQFMLISGAQFAGNVAALTGDISAYELLDQKLSQIAQQKIGAFVPPIPLQPNDVKAAQINAAMAQEKELQESLLENWLIQFAPVAQTISKRLCNPLSPDPVAKAVREKLLTKLNAVEIQMLSNQFPVQSVMDYTEFKARQRGQFAASVMDKPLFRQSFVARAMAEGVGDESFVNNIVVPEGDMSDQTTAANAQMCELGGLALGQPVPILPNDLDWIHMGVLKPVIMRLIQDGKFGQADLCLKHYAAHFAQGVNKKTIPNDQINDTKGWIAAAEKAVEALQQRAAMLQQHAQIAQAAQTQAEQMVAQGHPAASEGQPAGEMPVQ